MERKNIRQVTLVRHNNAQHWHNNIILNHCKQFRYSAKRRSVDLPGVWQCRVSEDLRRLL